MRIAFAAVLCVMISPALAQEDAIRSAKEWFAVPSDMAAITFFIKHDMPEVLFKISDDTEKPLDLVKWPFSQPFIRQYRLPPGDYQLHFLERQSNPSAITLTAGENRFVQLGADLPNAHNAGIVMYAYASADAPIQQTFDVIQALYSEGVGELVEPVTLEPKGKVLYVNTEPPWPVPPPPKQ